MKTRKTKKIMALLLIFLLMVASVPLLAFGASLGLEDPSTGTGDIKMSVKDQGDTFKAYKLIDVTHEGGNTAYKWNDNFAIFFSLDRYGYNGKTPQDIINLSGADLQTFLQKLKEYINTNSTDATSSSVYEGNKAVFKGLSEGSYAIYTDATVSDAVYQYILGSVQAKGNADDKWDISDVDVDLKYNEVRMDVAEEGSASTAESVSATVGETIEATLYFGIKTGYGTTTATIEPQTESLVAQTAGVYAVKSDGSEQQLSSGTYTITDNKNLTVTEDQKTGLLNDGYAEIKFKVGLNQQLIYSGEGDEAVASLKAGKQEVKGTVSNPLAQNSSVSVTATVFTYGFSFTNLDAVGQSKLVGAEFELYSDESLSNKIIGLSGMKMPGGLIEMGTSTNDKEIVGLKPGKYYLKQTQAPNGYALNTDKLEIDITAPPTEAENYIKSGFKFFNTKMSDLPLTGGMGTTIFTITGIALMVAAGVLFVVSKKRESDVK